MEKQDSFGRIPRRSFLTGSAALAGVASLGIPVTGQNNTASPNETIGFALIGCGGMGNAHLDAVTRLKNSGYPVRIIAVCDVYQVRLDQAAAKTGAKKYTDYRKLLEDSDVDVVGIATPDHWHARMCIDAAAAGKDIYCEKPMTHWRELHEARQVVQAVSENKRVMQVGTQGMSDSIWEQIFQEVSAGKLGPVVSAQASDMRNGPLGVYDPASTDGQAKPGENLDWEAWLGSAPKRPFNSGRYFAYRSFWDYSGGVATDFFPHILTPIVRMLNLGFPHKVSAMGGQFAYKEGREIPDMFTLTAVYKDGMTVLLFGSICNGVNIPMLARGHKATVYPRQGPGAVIRPERAVSGDAPEIEITRTRGESLDEHFRDLLDCVKSRNRPRSHEELGLRVMTVLHMGIHSYLMGKTLTFDEETFGVVG